MSRYKTHSENPFASHRVRPGKIAFVFPPGESATDAIERLHANRWWGQIIGPHGSGKSTLLHDLIGVLREAGRDIVHVRFQGGKLIASDAAARRDRWTSSTQVIIDGYEQLGWFQRSRWRWMCRWRGSGLLVTAHQPVGLPTVFLTHVDNALAQRVAGKLLSEEPGVISPIDVTAALDEQGGNLRDALFQLYDLFEQRSRAAR